MASEKSLTITGSVTTRTWTEREFTAVAEILDYVLNGAPGSFMKQEIIREFGTRALDEALRAQRKLTETAGWEK